MKRKEIRQQEVNWRTAEYNYKRHIRSASDFLIKGDAKTALDETQIANNYVSSFVQKYKCNLEGYEGKVISLWKGFAQLEGKLYAQLGGIRP